MEQTIETPPRPPAHDAYPPTRGPHHRSPLLAGFLSVVPGLGNVYNGLYIRGLSFFFLINGLFALAFRVGSRHNSEHVLALIIPAMIFFWFFNLFDAYRQAVLINYGGGTDLGLSERPKLAGQGSGGMMLGVALALVGLYGLLDSLFGIDLSALLDYWYVIFLAFGGWLIYQSIQNRKEAARASSDTAIDPSIDSLAPLSTHETVSEE